jgi:UDP-glucose 4-epimerase
VKRTIERKTVLVVGAAGFIGRHVTKALAEAGHDVTALDVAPPEESPGVRWIQGSVTDEPLLTGLAKAHAQVIYLAGGSLPASANADMAGEVATNLHATVRTAEICARAGVTNFVFASSGGTVYGASNARQLSEQHPTKPLNAYGVSKLASEHYLRIVSVMTGLTIVTLRISNPYGEGQRATKGQGLVAAAMAAAYSQEVLPCWGDGSVVRDFVYRGDVAAAFVAACRYAGPSTTINVGAGSGKSVLEMIAAVELATRRKIKVDFQLNRVIDAPRNVLAIGRAAKLLGWRPQVPLDDGITRTARWWQAEAERAPTARDEVA